MKGIILILSLGIICFTTLAIADFEQEKPHTKSIFVEYVNRFLYDRQVSTEDMVEPDNSETLNESCD